MVPAQSTRGLARLISVQHPLSGALRRIHVASPCTYLLPHAVFRSRKHSTLRTMASPQSSYSSLPMPQGFADASAESFAVAIMGDLHLSSNTDDMALFHEARQQLKEMTSAAGQAARGGHQLPSAAGHAARVVQLGDLGSYERGWPGSSSCFSHAKRYIQGFDVPTALVLGNHDLEADEFETDEANLAAWHAAFGHRHYWSADLGPATLVGLSTVRFRSNTHSVHEVHIDEEQLKFLDATLAAAKAGGRPVVMFTHAPAMGSGLKAIQKVHVKNRCAWLNHSTDPTHFLRLLQTYPDTIKLWFSGHFHLSQNYPDAISTVGGTAFVLTGVIGDAFSRDGHRQSRLLTGNADGFEMFTVDHDAGSTRLDLRGRWADPGPPENLVPAEELLTDISTGWLCSKIECSLDEDTGMRRGPMAVWLNAGPTTMLAVQDGVLVEYDSATMAPIGAVFLEVPENVEVRLVDALGKVVDAVGTDGSSAVAVELWDEDVQQVVGRSERNEEGLFYQIFQKNKWVARKKKEAEERARAEGAVAV